MKIVIYEIQELKKDKDDVMQAVAQNGLSLQFASKELQNDKDVVIKAVAQNGGSL